MSNLSETGQRIILLLAGLLQKQLGAFDFSLAVLSAR